MVSGLDQVGTNAAAWLLNAGAWSERWSRREVVPSFQSAVPVVLVGALWRSRHEPVTAWRDVLATTGGDLSALPEWPGLPLTSVWVNAAAASLLMEAGTLDDVVRLAIQRGWRVIRHASLDGWMDDRVRVLEVVTSLQRGGAERLVLDLHAGLKTAPLITTHLCVVGSPTRAAFTMPDDAIQLGVGVEPEARAAALVEVMSHMGCDVLHAHLLDGVVIDLLTAAGVTVLLTLHNSRAGWQPGYEVLKANGKLMLAACARTVEDEARAALPDVPVRTAWNGIAPTVAGLCEAGPDKLGSSDEDGWLMSNEALRLRGHRHRLRTITLVSVANPRPQKRLDRLPAIVAVLVARGFDARLVLAGEASRGHPVAEAEEEKLKLAAEQ